MRPVIPDTSVWIGFLREGKAERYLRHALRTRSVWLASVVAYELYLGATTREHRRDLDRIRRAFVTAGLVTAPAFSDWCDAAMLLEGYARLKGALEAHRHLTDALVVLCAARVGGRALTWNVRDLSRWNRMLPARRRIRVETPSER